MTPAHLVSSLIAASAIATLALACSSATPEAEGPDAGAKSDKADVPQTPECSKSIWYVDADGDGYGDSTKSVEACEQPTGHVAASTDCDDTNSRMHPGMRELCDGGDDNDCDDSTTEVCPIACTPHRTDANRVYLFCDKSQRWETAQQTCATQQMLLVRIDDGDELKWVVDAAKKLLGSGGGFWLGANDRDAESTWAWADGEQFWQGGPGGDAVNSLYVNWRSSQPDDANSNNSVHENCAVVEARSGSTWDDRRCSDLRKYVCELYPDDPASDSVN